MDIHQLNPKEMKKFFLIGIVSALTIFSSCGDKGPEEVPVPLGMVACDLSEFGMDLIINIPDSTHGPTEKFTYGEGVQINVGKAFGIMIKPGTNEIEYMKSTEIGKSEVYKLDKYILDEPTAIIWSWGFEGQPTQNRLYCVVNVGDVTYEVMSDPNGEFSEEACKKMLECARTLRAKTPAKS